MIRGRGRADDRAVPGCRGLRRPGYSAAFPYSVDTHGYSVDTHTGYSVDSHTGVYSLDTHAEVCPVSQNPQLNQ
jgi:hypothetical protein